MALPKSVVQTSNLPTIAQRFTTECLTIQISLARQVAASLKCRVYVYDSVNAFFHAQQFQVIINSKPITYLRTSQGLVGLLSGTAQNIVGHHLIYIHLSGQSLSYDAWGVYLE